MVKVLMFPALMVFSCLLAAFYGALHNQISYSVAPGYFHEFKFLQFAVAPELQNRVGAALVGVRASWWMGIVIGIPVYLAALFVQGTSAFIKAYVLAASVVVAVTFVMGVGALMIAEMTFAPDILPVWMEGRQVKDPVAFAKAGSMHNNSYLGGLVGLLVGLVVLVWRGWQSRRRTML
ncbi:MAG: hypothetical protein AAF252_03235 [Pseudomonadota bacterium]